MAVRTTMFLSLGTLLFTGLDLPGGAARAAVVLAFGCFAPGASAVALLWPQRRRFGGQELLIAVALSLAVCIGAAMVMLETDWWHPEAVVTGLAAVTAVVAGAASLRDPADDPTGGRSLVGRDG